MASNLGDQDSGQTAVEQEDKSVLPASKQSGDERGSNSGLDASALAERLDKLEKQLEAERRAAQSEKDRGVRRVTERQDRLEEEIALFKQNEAYLKAYGSSEQAARQKLIDEQIRRQPIQAADRGAAPSEGLDERARRKLEKMELSPAEQDAVRREWRDKAPKGGFTNDDDAIDALYDHAVAYRSSKARRDTPVPSAAAASPKGNVPPEGDTEESLTNRLTQLIGGNLRDPAVDKEISAIRAKLAGLRTK
jgi:hypothetical protein